jgi:hypothetical protein
MCSLPKNCVLLLSNHCDYILIVSERKHTSTRKLGHVKAYLAEIGVSEIECFLGDHLLHKTEMTDSRSDHAFCSIADNVKKCGLV